MPSTAISNCSKISLLSEEWRVKIEQMKTDFFGLFTNHSCFQTENSNDGEKTQWKAFPCKWKTFPCKRRTFPRTRKTFPYRFFLMRRKFFSHHWHVWVGVASISGGIPIVIVKNNLVRFYKGKTTCDIYTNLFFHYY